MKTEKEPRYRLELTRSQLALISHCVEDCSRFAAGQTEMWHTVMAATQFKDIYMDFCKGKE